MVGGGAREGNRAQVLGVLRRRGPVSRAEIARHTGLSRTTISSLVRELRSSGLVEETGELTAGCGVGRPARGLRLAGPGGVLIGLDFRHDRIHAVVGDLSLNILGERDVEVDVDHKAQTAIGMAPDLVKRLLTDSGLRGGQVLGVVAGIPAPMDVQRASRSRSLLTSWLGLDPAAELSEHLGMPVGVENDANLAALAECEFGPARGARVAAYVHMTRGTGMGLVIDGEILAGASGVAGEIGHVVVDDRGPMCFCGNRGCLATYVGGEALCGLLEPAHGKITLSDLVALVQEGDNAARRVVEDAGRTVGRVLANLCTYVNPAVVVVGGELAATGEVLLGPMREAVRRFSLPTAADAVRIVAGGLGDRAIAFGALTLAARRIQMVEGVATGAVAA